MADIYARGFIEELQSNLNVKEPVKARYVLNQLDLVDSVTQEEAISALNRTEADFVIPLIIGVLAERQDLAEACPSLRQVLLSKALSAKDQFLDLFRVEKDMAKKMVFTETAGEVEMKEAGPIIRRFLSWERDGRLLQQAIKALGKIGDVDSVLPISEFLYSWNAELMIASIVALEQIGSHDALERLAKRLGSDRDVDHIILETFATSRRLEALEKLNDALSSTCSRIRKEAKRRLARAGERCAPLLLKNLSSQDPYLLVDTIDILGNIEHRSRDSAMYRSFEGPRQEAKISRFLRSHRARH